MRKTLLLILLGLISIPCFCQKIETVSERFHYIYLKPEQDMEKLQKDIEDRQRNWQEEFEQMKANLAEGNRVSDNIKVEVTTRVEQDGDEINLIVGVSYETVRLAEEADDYALGKYTIDNSNACKLMCQFLKDKIENELASYFVEGTKVDLKLTGATDGTPIKSRIAYKGEYGDFVEKDIVLNDSPFKMTVTQKSGITTNGQLAFLRTQGVEDFLKHQVEPLQRTDNRYEIYAVENREKGGGYRRVSIEMILHNAFKIDVEPQNTAKP